MNPIEEWLWPVIVSLPVLAYLAWQQYKREMEKDK